MEAANTRRVTVGEKDDSWTECGIDPACEVGRFLLGGELRQLCRDVTVLPLCADSTKIWGNIYNNGEFIPWHTDTLGSVQLLLNLSQPPNGYGGTLILCDRERPEMVTWSVGDALIFDATSVPHSSTPVLDSGSSNIRVTAVARYFEEQKDQIELLTQGASLTTLAQPHTTVHSPQWGRWLRLRRSMTARGHWRHPTDVRCC